MDFKFDIDYFKILLIVVILYMLSPGFLMVCTSFLLLIHMKNQYEQEKEELPEGPCEAGQTLGMTLKETVEKEEPLEQKESFKADFETCPKCEKGKIVDANCDQCGFAYPASKNKTVRPDCLKGGTECLHFLSVYGEWLCSEVSCRRTDCKYRS